MITIHNFSKLDKVLLSLNRSKKFPSEKRARLRIVWISFGRSSLVSAVGDLDFAAPYVPVH